LAPASGALILVKSHPTGFTWRVMYS
jgi:hypothetical protein